MPIQKFQMKQQIILQFHLPKRFLYNNYQLIQNHYKFYQNQQNFLQIKMGNQICDAVGKQGQYSRNKVLTLNTDQIQKSQSSPQHPKSLLKFQESPFQNDQIQFSYKTHLIKCKRKNVRFVKIQQTQKQKAPIINGYAKIYKAHPIQEIYYQGEMRKSKFDGFGKLYKQKKVVYEGQFKNNQFDGWGITPEYQGQFRQGKYDGYGIYKQYQNKAMKFITFYYEGYFQMGLYSGSGVLIKGCKCPLVQIERIHNQQGIFDYLSWQIQHGMQLIDKYGAKQIYIGQFSNGYRHGFGRLFTDKMQFSGQFSHNLYHGLGTIYNRTNQGKLVTQAVFKMGKQYKN